MNIRFFNARILSMVEGQDIFDGEMWVEDSKITYVGAAMPEEEREKLNKKFTRNIDCDGNLLMPGFKDAHTHSGMTLMRSYADGLPLQEWLETKIFPLEAKMTDEDCGLLTKLAVLEYLTSGITAIMDMYLSPDAIAKACEETGMRVVQVSGINKFGPSLEVFEDRYNRLNGKHPLSSYMMGFHAEYTCDRELLEKLSELAHKYSAPMFTHNSETVREVEECKERYGMTPTVFLDSLGLFDFGGGGYHCCHMSDEDIEIFKKRSLTAVTNPGSNTKLASGIAPVKRFLDEGINVAIGTDGPSSNNCLDMFREMFLVTGLAKLREKDASVVNGMEVLKMATVNGAKAMGLDDCDVLAEGKEADLIMIDLKQPNMQPINDIPNNLVYSGSKQNVKLTMIHGSILYEDGKFNVGMTPGEIYKAAGAIQKRLF
ncbi:MAG: amidohydrolase [Lachnospiraceae bacterium]|nr:amidohydrolase [Lachnospiraceae bacterium]